MPGRPPEGEIKAEYHEFNDSDARQWVIDGKQSVRMALLPGPADSWSSDGLERRVGEYKKLLVRMKDRRRQSLEAEIQKAALGLYDEKRKALADRELKGALAFISHRAHVEYEACLVKAKADGVTEAMFKRAWELNERTHEKIAEDLRKHFPVASEFGITISREYVTRALIAGKPDLERHVSGNSTSTLNFTRKPAL